MPFDRTNRLRVDYMLDAISFVVDSSYQIQELLKKAKGALSKLFLLIFLKLDQEKTLGELVNDFFIDTDGTIEVLKRTSRLYGALLAFQRLKKALPKNKDGSTVDLGLYSDPACRCACQLLKLVEAQSKQSASEAIPSTSTQTRAP
jgi:hypothetical protein